MRSWLVAVLVVAAAWGQRAEAAIPRPTFPGTPAVRIITVSGGDFVHIGYMAGGFYRADEALSRGQA